MSADKNLGIFSRQMEAIVYIFPINFQNHAFYEKYLKVNKLNSLHLLENRLGYLPLDIIRSSKLTVTLSENVRFSEYIMSADKYSSIFPHQMEAIVYLSNRPQVSMVYKLINQAGCWKNTRRIRKSFACDS